MKKRRPRVEGKARWVNPPTVEQVLQIAAALGRLAARRNHAAEQSRKPPKKRAVTKAKEPDD
jgi:hypothetical protein